LNFLDILILLVGSSLFLPFSLFFSKRVAGVGINKEKRRVLFKLPLLGALLGFFLYRQIGLVATILFYFLVLLVQSIVIFKEKKRGKFVQP